MRAPGLRSIGGLRGRGVARKIILLSDGTGNSAAKVWRTNVWRTFEALDLSGSDQVAFYDDGVGTSSFRPLAMLGGAFGFGLKRNVIALYEFACRNMRDDADELFAFGFSRGAFTIRLVIGMIFSQGLVRADEMAEGELHWRAHAAYRAYRRDRFYGSLRLASLFLPLSPAFEKARSWINGGAYAKAQNRMIAGVRFLGLWDTVAAYGLPVDEMTAGVDKWLWPLVIPNCDLNPKVMRACQALSIDDERTTFHPVLWNEKPSDQATPGDAGRKFTYDERISQVWFPGVHANVGGGYPDDTLSQVSLYWMLRQARHCGLKLKAGADAPDAMLQARTARDKDGRLYDPRSGLGGTYRYGPRKIADLCAEPLSRGRDGGAPPNPPKIHESVFKRIQNGAHFYAPAGLPGAYEVVDDHNEILSVAQAGYESPQSAAARALAQEAAWDKVWLKRGAYLLTALAAALLVAYPLATNLKPTDEMSSPLRWISQLIHMAGIFAPTVGEPWVTGYARSPGYGVIIVALVYGFYLWSARLQGELRGAMQSIWRQSLRKESPAPWRSRFASLRAADAYRGFVRFIKLKFAPFVFALSFVWLGLTLASHALFDVEDDAGFVCRGHDPKTLDKGPDFITLSKGDVATTHFRTNELCHASGVMLDEGAYYYFNFSNDDAWLDSDIPVPFPVYSGGYGAVEAPRWQDFLLLASGLPLRRSPFQPWFRLVGRFGSMGGEEYAFDPKNMNSFEQGAVDKPGIWIVRAPRSGEFFHYVNDAVIGVPGLHDWFYRNNRGSGTLTITRTE